MFYVIDRASRNVVGEFKTFPDAKSFYLRLVAVDRDAATTLVIMTEDGDDRPVAREEIDQAVAYYGQRIRTIRLPPAD